MDLNTIGAYIAMLRRQRGLSQRELAERIGVSNQAVSKWENGDNLPDIALLLPLAELLHTTVDALLSAGEGRFRHPVDMTKLHAGIAGLQAALAAFGEESALGRRLTEGIQEQTGLRGRPALQDAQSRETLLAEAVMQRLLEGETLPDSVLEAEIREEKLRQRIIKCRHDCALFADRQQIYDDFRPSYPKEAVQLIRAHTGPDAVVADVGSGTGKLAVLLAPNVKKLYAVEPNVHMRRVLSQRTEGQAQVQVVSALAEHLPLADQSVDAITVAEAYHWFDNEETRREFRRILRPGGRIFLLWNHFEHNDYDERMRAIEQQYRTYPRPKQRTGAERADDLFGQGRWQRFTFDNTMHQTFRQFYGGMSSASYAPEAGTVAGEAFRRAVQELFDDYALKGQLTTHVTAVCYVGSPEPKA